MFRMIQNYICNNNSVLFAHDWGNFYEKLKFAKFSKDLLFFVSLELYNMNYRKRNKFKKSYLMEYNNINYTELIK